MAQAARVLRTFLQIVGVGAILVAIWWFGLRHAVERFSGGNWTDTPEQELVSPHGIHTVKTLHRMSGPDEDYLVYVSSGDPNRKDSFVLVAYIRDVSPGQSSVQWDGPDRLLIMYPRSAKVSEAVQKTHDVLVLFDPPLTAPTAN